MISAAHDKLRRLRRWLVVGTVVTAVAMVGLEAILVLQPASKEPLPRPKPTPTPALADAGKVLSRADEVTFAPEQVEGVSRQNYGGYTPRPQYGVRKTVVQYRSYEPDGTPIIVYARVYQPIGKTAAPIFGFAPGTVGIGDQCAPSLEDPAKANWANYESHMLTYAGQGYATVITDYEGMRDNDRLHHYMVGPLEGRAVLDSVRALINLDAGTDQLDTNHVFVGGYSQGGHAAFWADQIAATYAPELHLAGVVGFGPVMDVRETLTDILHGANIDWFGPYLLVSYGDYYRDAYNLADTLQPRYQQNLQTDVLSHCIDTNLTFWPHVPAQVYAPAFLGSLADNLTDARFSRFKERMDANIVGAAKTTTAKLINSGLHDNVVLPAQQDRAMSRLCPNSKGPVELKKWPTATHYNTMAQSFADTLGWMGALTRGQPVASTCTP